MQLHAEVAVAMRGGPCIHASTAICHFVWPRAADHGAATVRLDADLLECSPSNDSVRQTYMPWAFMSIATCRHGLSA